MNRFLQEEPKDAAPPRKTPRGLAGTGVCKGENDSSETSIFALSLGVYTRAWSNSHAIMHALNYTHYALNLRDFGVSHKALV